MTNKHSFKDIARKKQARYFEDNHNIKEFATIKRKPKGYKNLLISALIAY